jgi:hypothetical protein
MNLQELACGPPKKPDIGWLKVVELSNNDAEFATSNPPKLDYSHHSTVKCRLVFASLTKSLSNRGQ